MGKARRGPVAAQVLDTIPLVWERIRLVIREASTGSLGVSLEQFHVLRHIRAGCGNATELASRRQVSVPAISQAIDALVAKGLVTRAQEEGDRRRVALALTPLAAKVLDDKLDETRAWIEGRLASLDAGQLEVVRAALDSLRLVFGGPEDTA